MRDDRFILQPSADSSWWVATDTQYGIVCKFAEHDFNGSQKFTVLDDRHVDHMSLAKAAREMADWLLQNHPQLLY